MTSRIKAKWSGALHHVLIIWPVTPWQVLSFIFVRYLTTHLLTRLWMGITAFDDNLYLRQLSIYNGDGALSIHQFLHVINHRTDQTHMEMGHAFLKWILAVSCPLGWGCRIHRLHLCRGVRSPLMSVLDMILNYLMVRFQWCWRFGECGVPLYCHCSQVHSGLSW